MSDILEPSNEHAFPKSWIFDREHPRDQVIGDISKGVQTRSSTLNVNVAFISLIEPKKVD